MKYEYQIIDSIENSPINIFIHSVNEFKMHFHSELEILLILKGSTSVRVEDKKFILKENDLIIINSNEVHSTSKTSDENIILSLQIDTRYYSRYKIPIDNIKFTYDYLDTYQNNLEDFNKLRKHLANIVWQLNKESQGYQLLIGSEIHRLLFHLLNSFSYSILDKDEDVDSDIILIQNILKYIDDNLEKGVSLTDIAEREHLSVSHLSRFIKKNLGLSFQDYLNNIRIDKATSLLLNTNETITNIAFKSGFPSTKSLNQIFRRNYKCTPTEYRQEHLGKKNVGKAEKENLIVDKNKSKTYLDVDRTTAFKKLFTYLEPRRNRRKDDKIKTNYKQEININGKGSGKRYRQYWKKLTTFGRAYDGLRIALQEQIREVQKNLKFEYVRFHGIFCDEMMVYNIDENGQVVYNWSYVDELFDFLKEVNLKPFVELSFMPFEIRSTDDTMYWRKANVSQPKEIGLWKDLVEEFVKHCINRYGLDEVEGWYFEVWNEPELEGVYWIGGKDEYFEFFKETYLSIKSISKRLKVGGPSIASQAGAPNNWLEDFLIYCNENKIILDFISAHIYPEKYIIDESFDGSLGGLLAETWKGSMEDILASYKNTKKIYFDKDHTRGSLVAARQNIDRCLDYDAELHITEWNSSAYGRNFIHDTCFESTFIIYNILKSIGHSDSLGHWTLSDIMEETKAGISAFHGGFGLMNKDGLKKPSYYAYYLLSKLGLEIIDQGDEHIVTRDGEDIQILAYNFAYFDNLFLQGDTSSLSHKERYSVFEEKPVKQVEISIEDIYGYYKISRYKLDREHGSVFDEWLKMGAVEDMTREEINYLKGKAQPEMTIDYVDIDGLYGEKLYINVHGAELIKLEKKIKETK